MRLKIFLALTALSISACATSAPTYQAATSSSNSGYSETAIESNRYRITYRGRDAATVNDFALRRAAELTLIKGYDWFEVVSSDTEQTRNNSGSSVSVGGSTGSYGRSSVGVGVGVGIPLGGGRETYTRRLEIVMGKGEKPDSANAYDATAVRANLGS